MLADAALRAHDNVRLAAIVQPPTSSNVEAGRLEVVRDVALMRQLVRETTRVPSVEGERDLREDRGCGVLPAYERPEP
jgi:hypothetical protein